MSEKLFIVTRSDLAPGARAAQSVHAALAFAYEHQDLFRQWYEGSNNIVLVETSNEGALVRLEDRAVAAEIPCSLFKEPDFGDAVTGVAIASAGGKLVSNLPLTLREPKAA